VLALGRQFRNAGMIPLNRRKTSKLLLKVIVKESRVIQPIREYQDWLKYTRAPQLMVRRSSYAGQALRSYVLDVRSDVPRVAESVFHRGITITVRLVGRLV
jgi:hypothetical protein